MVVEANRFWQWKFAPFMCIQETGPKLTVTAGGQVAQHNSSSSLPNCWRLCAVSVPDLNIVQRRRRPPLFRSSHRKVSSLANNTVFMLSNYFQLDQSDKSHYLSSLKLYIPHLTGPIYRTCNNISNYNEDKHKIIAKKWS